VTGATLTPRRFLKLLTLVRSFHSKVIFHGDIRPLNVLVGSNHPDDIFLFIARGFACGDCLAPEPITAEVFPGVFPVSICTSLPRARTPISSFAAFHSALRQAVDKIGRRGLRTSKEVAG